MNASPIAPRPLCERALLGRNKSITQAIEIKRGAGRCCRGRGELRLYIKYISAKTGGHGPARTHNTLFKGFEVAAETGPLPLELVGGVGKRGCGQSSLQAVLRDKGRRGGSDATGSHPRSPTRIAHTRPSHLEPRRLCPSPFTFIWSSRKSPNST